MDYPPTPASFRNALTASRLRVMGVDRLSLSRWLGVGALAFLTAGMGLTLVEIEMSSAPLLMLALPDLKMSGAQALGPFGVLSLAFTLVFVLSLFRGPLFSLRRVSGFCAVALWLATLGLAAVEVNTAFEAVLSTIAVLNRGETVPDLTARLTPMLALWFTIPGLALLIAATVWSRRIGRDDSAERSA